MAPKHYEVRTFASGASIGYLLKMSQSLMLSWATARFEAHDLSFIQWLALLKLKEGAVVTAGDLCRSMCYDNGAVTRLIDQLEERGFLTRERSKSDRRVVALKLTGAGEKKTAELIPVAVESLNDALSDFNKTEFVELTHLLNKLVTSLQSRQPTSKLEAAG